MLDISNKGNNQVHTKWMKLLNCFNQKVVWNQTATNSTELNPQFDIFGKR